MRYLTSSFLGLAAVAAIVVALAGGSTTPAADKAKADDPVRALQKERLTRLEKIHEWSLEAYKGGETSFDRVQSAHLALLNGKLDLCETNAERVKVREDMVKVAEEFLKTAQRLFEAKMTNRIDLLKAEVQLLDARIGLEKAKAAK